MTIKFQKLNKSVKIPSYAHPGDAGLDLYSQDNVVLKPGQRHEFALGFALEIPKNYVGLIWDKGSLPFLHGIHIIGGVFDSGYRGEYIIMLINLSQKSYQIEKGDKIAQLLIQPIENVKIKEVKKLSPASRGKGRLGSTGRK
jgi:dUTP pyrophosphatase